MKNRFTHSCVHLQDMVTSGGMTRAVKRLVSQLTPVENEFEAIAFRGLSGALVAPSVAQILQKDVIAVRKDESRNSKYDVEGVMVDTYIIVDDFIDDCETVKAIVGAIYGWHSLAKLVGIALYNNNHMGVMGNLFLKKHKGVWAVHTGVAAPYIYKEKREYE